MSLLFHGTISHLLLPSPSGAGASQLVYTVALTAGDGGVVACTMTLFPWGLLEPRDCVLLISDQQHSAGFGLRFTVVPALSHVGGRVSWRWGCYRQAFRFCVGLAKKSITVFL